jgi:hypothetical protein
MDLIENFCVCVSDINYYVYYYYQAYEGVYRWNKQNVILRQYETIKQNSAVNIKNSNGTCIYNIIIFLLPLLPNVLK